MKFLMIVCIFYNFVDKFLRIFQNNFGIFFFFSFDLFNATMVCENVRIFDEFFSLFCYTFIWYLIISTFRSILIHFSKLFCFYLNHFFSFFPFFKSIFYSIFDDGSTFTQFSTFFRDFWSNFSFCIQFLITFNNFFHYCRPVFFFLTIFVPFHLIFNDFFSDFVHI